MHACESENCAFAMFKRKVWNPYFVGACIGILSWVTFYTMDKALGTSTTMVHLSALVTGAVAPDRVIGDAANAYYAAQIAPPKKNMFDWQFFLVLGMLGGALAASVLWRDRIAENVPALWQWRFGPGRIKRYFFAFLGGAILLFGARMADGCTSGHGISGGLQLAVSSWTFFIAMFVSGVITAFALFGKEGRNHVYA
jgi:hypothetical protein